MSRFTDSMIRSGRFDFAEPRPDTIAWFNALECAQLDPTNRVYKKGKQLQINGFPVDVVAWSHTNITIFELRPGADAISFDFTGCVMALYDLNGTRYAAHIQCDDGDCKQEWINYIRANSGLQVLAMFRPDDDRSDKVRKADRTSTSDVWLLGVITPDLQCYSVCVRGGEFERQHFTVEFIEHHPMPFQVDGYTPVLNPQGDISAAWDAFWKSYQPRTVYPADGVNLATQPVKKSCCQ